MATKIPDNVIIDHEAGTDRSVFATWKWTEAHTDHFEVWWEYSTANAGVWFTGSESSEKHNISQYSYPDNAKVVRFRVKPVAEKKSGGDSEYWTAGWSKTKTYDVPVNAAVKAIQYPKAPSDLTLTLEAGTDRTYHARCVWDWSNTEFVLVRWMYRTADKEWFFGTTEEVSDYYVNPVTEGKKTVNHNVWESIWTVPSNAVKVRCQARPVSAIAYETDETTTYYWSTPWSEWTNEDLSDSGPQPATNAPSKLKIDVQNGTDRTLFATWSWEKSKTDHYFTHWQYATGDVGQDGKIVWYEGSTGDVTVKNSVYNAPENATKVRFWVKAYGQTGATWSESKTSEVKTYSNLTAKVTGAVDSSSIKVTYERRNENSVIASWLWNKHAQTDHYEVEWQYSAGDQDAQKKFIYHTSASTSQDRSSLYSPPSNATRVQVRVKPIASDNSFTAPWSKFVGFTFSESVKTTTKTKKTVSFKNGQALILEDGTDRTLIARWTWTEKNTASYNVTWQYSTGQGIWLYADRNKSVDHEYDTYTAPANATSVRFYVRPIAQTKKVQGVDTPYWTAETSSVIYYRFTDTGEPSKAPTPSVLLDGQILTAELNIYDELADKVLFEVVKNDSQSFKTLTSEVNFNHAAVRCSVDLGGEYKVRSRAVNNVESYTTELSVMNKASATQYGEWSEYSEPVTTIPATPDSILWHKTIAETEVQLCWAKVGNVTGYKIEYTTNKEYFDQSDQTTVIDVSGTGDTYIVTGLETGQTYFFRVCAVNDSGQSSWTPNYKDNQSYPVVLGTRPSPPTTWSDTTSAIIGEDLYLYWTHNSEDESAQSDAEVELTINGTTIIVEPTYMSDGSIPSYYIFNTENELGEINRDYGIVTDSDPEPNPILDDTEEEITSVSDITTSNFEGAVIIWRVRTKGVLQGDDGWSNWSTARTLIVYAQPTLTLYVGNNLEHNDTLYELNRYPLLVYAEAFPTVQHVIGFNVSIIANESYETRDSRGNRMSVRDQQAVFQKYYPAANGNILDISLTAGDMSLENEITYTVTVSAAMDSSLTAENNWTFIARWDGDVLVPDAEIGINQERLSAYIRPFCNDEDGDLIDGVYLAVYRIEYDGRLVEIASNLPNGEITITDPHPSLNYARYRVVATYEETGVMGFRDIPGVFVGETGIVVQWDEEWNPFFTNDGAYQDVLDETTDSGSILKLPYNIEVSDSNDMDVALNEYIGRAHPVSYYGTQLGIKGGWNGTIRRDDIETIYALRRLAVYRGDAYVREPSGVGYWANVRVSFSKRYNEMVIPVTLDVTRVEGGI